VFTLVATYALLLSSLFVFSSPIHPSPLIGLPGLRVVKAVLVVVVVVRLCFFQVNKPIDKIFVD